MFLLKQILPAAIIAMMVAAGVCGLVLLWGKDRVRSALAAIALGVAYFVGHFFITGRVSFPPADTTNWLPYFALVGALLGAMVPLSRTGRKESLSPEIEEVRGTGRGRGGGWARVLIFALVSGGALRLLLKPKFQYTWSLSQGWIWVAGLAGAMVLLALILDALARRSETAVEMPAFLLITCAGTFGALMLSGSMVLGQFAAVLAAALFGGLLFTVRKVTFGRAIVPVFVLLLGALLVSGYFFAELPAASAVMLGLAPVLALVPVGRPSKLLAFGMRAALVSVPVIVALVLAFRSSPPLDY
jgi:hypothetical protein